MKQIINLACVFIFVLVTGCAKKQPIPENELTGTWEPKGSFISKPKIEITSDLKLHWDKSWGSKDEEFTIKYDINKNKMQLYKEGCQHSSYQADVVKSKKGILSFSMPEYVYDFDGNLTLSYTNYIRKD